MGGSVDENAAQIAAEKRPNSRLYLTRRGPRISLEGSTIYIRGAQPLLFQYATPNRTVLDDRTYESTATYGGYIELTGGLLRNRRRMWGRPIRARGGMGRGNLDAGPAPSRHR